MLFIDHLVPSVFWLIGWRLLFFIGLTFLLYRYFKNLGTKAKAIDAPSRWSSGTKPTIGGLVFLAAFLLALIPFLLDYKGHHGYIWILLAGIAAFSLGLWDDLKRISPSKKLIGQIVVAVLFVFSEHASPFFSDDYHGDMIAQMLQWGVTILVVVAIMNSINMLDNMDGVATIAALPVLLFAFTFDCDDGFVAITMVIACCAFLVFNWTPSKIYMGDSGSMLLGLILSWMLLGADSCGERMLEANYGISRLLLVLGLGTLFISDTLVVCINRIRHGLSPMKGGRDHTTHNLFYLGLTQWQIAVLFIIQGGLQLVLTHYFVTQNRSAREPFEGGTPIILYFFLIFGFHLWLSVRNLRKGKYAYS